MIADTKANLAAAADGEKHENTEMYPDFSRVAEEEGFPDIAAVFRSISVSEKGHEMRCRAFLANIVKGQVFKRETTVRWRCRNCGYVHEGPEAPEACPACNHPRAFFELLVENYWPPECWTSLQACGPGGKFSRQPQRRGGDGKADSTNTYVDEGEQRMDCAPGAQLTRRRFPAARRG